MTSPRKYRKKPVEGECVCGRVVLIEGRERRIGISTHGREACAVYPATYEPVEDE